MRHVVDTNVAIVANGRNTNAKIDCRLATIDFLNKLINNGQVILDMKGDIQAEYHRHLSPSGQPGVGDQFYQTILQSAPSRVSRIELAIDEETKQYIDFPADPELATFDQSDRKFAAAARKSGVPLANAVDTDWLDHKGALARNGISVLFVCGCDRKDWINADIEI